MPELIEHSGLPGCGCGACASGFSPDLYDGGVFASVDGQAGTVGSNGKPIWSPEMIAAHLNRTGAGWGNVANQQTGSDSDLTVINFGFHESTQTLWDNGYVFVNPANGRLTAFSEFFNFAAFTPAQREAARTSMQLWDDVVAATFQETHVNDADIAFGNLASAPTTQAYAYLPNKSLNMLYGGQVGELGGDVWVSLSQANNLQLDDGQYGLHTLVHEIGHAIGISHPGAYNAAPGVSITYAKNAEYYQDTRGYSVMSYFNASTLGARHFDFNISTTVYASTPLIHDILAAQRIYGVDTQTRTGDTVYGFNSNAGRAAFDFTLTPAPVMAIWDAGGIDTLDASGYATNQVIDLRQGSLSSIGGVTYETAPSFEQVNANRAAVGLGPIPRSTYDSNMALLEANPVVGRLTDNVGIAYGAVIENAVGGSGNDLLIGNDSDNILTANAGDDGLSGGAGNDALNGGAGNDVLLGGDGVDLHTGGAGDDIFVAEMNETLVDFGRGGEISLDIITDFGVGNDLIDLSGIDANALLDGHQGFTWVGHASPKGIGEVGFRTFGNINAAENALGLEIDGLDTQGNAGGPVTIIFGNTDDDSDPDFALVLMGKHNLGSQAFILGESDVEAVSASAASASFHRSAMQEMEMSHAMFG